jgi:hypothetical protein
MGESINNFKQMARITRQKYSDVPLVQNNRNITSASG